MHTTVAAADSLAHQSTFSRIAFVSSYTYICILLFIIIIVNIYGGRVLLFCFLHIRDLTNVSCRPNRIRTSARALAQFTWLLLLLLLSTDIVVLWFTVTRPEMGVEK